MIGMTIAINVCVFIVTITLQEQDMLELIQGRPIAKCEPDYNDSFINY
jgi:hypothetical protein